MGMTIDSQEFLVKTTPEPIGGDDGKRVFIGFNDEAENLIVIDGTVPASRQEEILLHELIHLTDSDIPEFMVNNISTRLYGFLRGNGLLVPNMLASLLDGEVSQEDMRKINDASNEAAEVAEEFGAIFPTDQVSEAPWVQADGRHTEDQYRDSLIPGSKIQLREPDGRYNRTAVHYASRDLLSGRAELGSLSARSVAGFLVNTYKSILKEDPPAALVRLAR